MMLKTNKRGFTLIELLVVIAIIGLLATIVLVSLNNARNKANNAKVKSDLSQVMLAVEMYYSDQIPATYPPTTWAALTTALEGGGYIHTMPVHPGGTGYTYTAVAGTSYSVTGALVVPDAGTWECANGSCFKQ
jgi:type II secretion system protein G